MVQEKTITKNAIRTRKMGKTKRESLCRIRREKAVRGALPLPLLV